MPAQRHQRTAGSTVLSLPWSRPTPTPATFTCRRMRGSLFDDDGRARRLLGVSWDITKEIVAAEQLRQQARAAARRRTPPGARLAVELRRSLGIGPGQQRAVVLVELSRPARLSRRRAAAHVSRAGTQLVHPEDLQRVAALMRATWSIGAPYVVDLRVRAASGEYRWFRLRGTAERDANGRAMLDVRARSTTFTSRSSPRTRCSSRSGASSARSTVRRTACGNWKSNGTAWCSPRLGELLGYAPSEFATDTNFLRAVPASGRRADRSLPRRRRTSSRRSPYDVEIRLRTQERRVSLVSRPRQRRTRRRRPAVAHVRFAAGRDRSARRARRAAAARTRSSRSGQPRQERVPRQREPRDPHADERHHRHDRPAARHGARSHAARLRTKRSAAAPIRC